MTEPNSTSNIRNAQTVCGLEGISRTTLTKYAIASFVIIVSLEAIFAAMCVLAHAVL